MGSNSCMRGDDDDDDGDDDGEGRLAAKYRPGPAPLLVLHILLLAAWMLFQKKLSFLCLLLGAYSRLLVGC